MKQNALLLSSVFALLAALSADVYAGGGTLTIPKKVPSKAKEFSSAQKECGLEIQAGEEIRQALKGEYSVVAAASVSKSTKGQALELHITEVLAPGGGPFSGPKSVTIEGTLWNNGKSLGSFKAARHTKHGAGTCNMLNRDIKEIAEDIANWMKSPKDGARLGDA